MSLLPDSMCTRSRSVSSKGCWCFCASAWISALGAARALPDRPAMARASASGALRNMRESGAKAERMDRSPVLKKLCLHDSRRRAGRTQLPCLFCPSHRPKQRPRKPDRKSTRLNSSHLVISYAVFCLKKKNIIHFSIHRVIQQQLPIRVKTLPESLGIFRDVLNIDPCKVQIRARLVPLLFYGDTATRL